MTLKIDKKTLDVKLGPYTRILVDVDMAAKLPKILILVKRKNFNFFVGIVYENLPLFIPSCGTIGHGAEGYRKKVNTEFQKEKYRAHQYERRGAATGHNTTAHMKDNENKQNNRDHERENANMGSVRIPQGKNQ